MKILVLDDDVTRINQFDTHFRKLGHEVHFAKSYREFVDKINQHSPFDFVTLDHDLGDFNPAHNPASYDPLQPREFTGQHAAALLRDLPPHLRPKSISIHSNNPAGSFAMQSILQQGFISAPIKPFTPGRLPVPN